MFPRRSAIPHHRLPLHVRALADPAALRRWLSITAVLAAGAGGIGRTVSSAEATRAAWGRTVPVMVTTRHAAAGAPLAAISRQERWPLALAPRGALADVPPGALASGPIDPGIPLTSASVSRSASSGPPAGRVALALSRGEHPLPIRSRDRVDLWATVDPALADGALTTQRLAIGAIVVRVSPRTVILAVRPREVADVAEATALATVVLVATGR